jgi:tetratricopeptide (TPR) repeat protein
LTVPSGSAAREEGAGNAAPPPRSESAVLPDDRFGDAAAAELYVRWAERAIEEGRLAEALRALERGADYADVSSDISYLLALTRFHEKLPGEAVLEALRRALEADRWFRYTPGEAGLLEAEVLIVMRRYAAALEVLNRGPDSADRARLRLLALRFLPDLEAFRREMAAALDRFPRDPRLPRLFLDYCRNGRDAPEGNEQALMDLILRRLPLLLDDDPELVWMAAPFIADLDRARRLVAAYRAVRVPAPASIPAGLELGLVDEEDALEELFGDPPEEGIDRDLILAVFALLRNGESRDLFRQRLFRYSGIVSADYDRDGHTEARTWYLEGTIRRHTLDADQNGLPDMDIAFDAGAPVRCQGLTDSGMGIVVFWERYPAVQRVELGGASYLPLPGDFFYRPLRFTELCGGGGEPGLLFPEDDAARLTLRTVVMSSLRITRPSAEFPGAMEIIDLDRGIPLRAVEILGGRTVSATEFAAGKPLVQRLDLDLDGRMETVRRFRDAAPGGGEADFFFDREKYIEFSESDRDGDGIFETGEEHFPDGTVIYSWDMDGDGIREYAEKRDD